MVPSTKVSVATLAAALGALIVFGLQTYGKLDLPPAAQAAIGTVILALLTLAAGYFTPETRPAPSAVATVLKRRGRAAELLRPEPPLRTGHIDPAAKPPP